MVKFSIHHFVCKRLLLLAFFLFVGCSAAEDVNSDAARVLVDAAIDDLSSAGDAQQGLDAGQDNDAASAASCQDCQGPLCLASCRTKSELRDEH